MLPCQRTEIRSSTKNDSKRIKPKYKYKKAKMKEAHAKITKM